MRTRTTMVLALALLSPSLPAMPAGWTALVETHTLTVESPGHYETASLEVGGPEGLRLTRSFANGEPVQLLLLAPDGSSLPDGRYRYEIRTDGPGYWQGAFRIEDGHARLVRESEQPAQPGALLPDERFDVEHHFADDLGTENDFCAGCSAAFEPGALAFGGERVAVVATSPGISLLTSESTDDLDVSWELGSVGGDIYLKNPATTAGGFQFAIEAGAPFSSLWIDDIGHVGIGTSLPSESVHVRQVGAKVLVNDSDPTAAPRAMFELRNLAGNQTIFRLNDGAAGIWDFKVSLGGSILNEVGDGNEMVVDKWGNVTATSFNPTSSRAMKRDFEPVDREAVLDRLAALPISEWSFRDRPGVRHLGPFAEDFHAAFGLNGDDDGHFSLTDVQGVALAAIQALAVQSETLRSEVETLELENAALLERLEALEQRLSSPGWSQ